MVERQPKQWDKLWISKVKFKGSFDEWNAQYYSHFGADAKQALEEYLAAHKAAAPIFVHRLVWDNQTLKREDIISILHKCFSKINPAAVVHTQASNNTKMFDCKGTLWRDRNVVLKGGGCGLILDTLMPGITRVDQNISVKDGNGVTKELLVSFEITPDEFSVCADVVPLGVLTDTFYHTEYNWIKRNIVLAELIMDRGQDVQISVDFVDNKLQVKAMGELSKVLELTEALAEGWVIKWDGKERQLRIGSASDFEAAAADRVEWMKQKNITTDSENGDRKLTVLGLIPECHQDDEVAQRVRDECEKCCVDGVIDDFGIKNDKNGNSFAWIRFTSAIDSANALKITGLAMILARAGFGIGIPTVRINKAIRADKPSYKSALTKSGVTELGDLKPGTGSGSWMVEVAKAYKQEPQTVAAAMVPFQEAARRGASTAMNQLATQVQQMFSRTSATEERLIKIEDTQDKIMALLQQMKAQQQPTRTKNRQANEDEDEDMDGDYGNHSQRRDSRERQRTAPDSKRKPKRGRAPVVSDDEESTDGEFEVPDPANKMLLGLLSTMKNNADGIAAMRGMAASDPAYAKFLKSNNLIK
jgi:hypothetical protein